VSAVLLGRKLGMTSIFDDSGLQIPCTVVEAGPCTVVQVKTNENDGYDAIQVGFDDVPQRKVAKPLQGHYKKANVKPKRRLEEIRFKPDGSDKKVGDTIDVSVFAAGDSVAVTGVTKGKGFQGTVKRHGFGGGVRTHGQSDRLRAPGSVGSSSYPSRVFKGLRMAGRMGGKKLTVRNLKVVKVIPESNLVLIRGAVPGSINGLVRITKL
jgi:large subunit ribosomal protein L3